MTKFQTLDDIDVAGKRVLVRVDLNVPMDGGRVTDTTRLDRLTATVGDLVAGKARIVLMSHFGRPKGKVVPEMSLRPVVAPLEEALGGRPVAFAEDCVGPAARRTVEALRDGEIALLENLRFHPGEEVNDGNFARALAELGELYIDDAFSCAHRAHASVEAIARLLPAAAGRLMQAELEALTKALGTPERPVAAIVGGAKVSTKLAVLDHLVGRVDVLVIGGGMANTFLNAVGKPVGRSLCEHELAGQARDILDHAGRAGCEVLLPTDAVVAAELAAGAASETVAVDAVPADAMILDIGADSVAAVNRRLGDCRTLVWNGPLGAFETPPFDAGTVAVANHAAALTRAGSLLSVAGGGDTIAALSRAEVMADFSYVSTAGGAFLEWLEGKELPGVAALEQGGAS